MKILIIFSLQIVLISSREIKQFEEKYPTFKEFEDKYHIKFIDPREEAAAKEEFAKHEAQVEQNNADYEAGMSNFKEEVEPWDDETIEQFEKEKEGLYPITRFPEEARGMGVIITPEHERINTPEDVAFFDQIYGKYDRSSIPATWDSRAKGNDNDCKEMLIEIM